MSRMDGYCKITCSPRSGYEKKDYKRDDCRKKDYRKDDCRKKDCKIKKPFDKKFFLVCGTPGSEMDFDTTGDTFDAANVTVDTRGSDKFVTELEFSSQVEAVLEPDDATQTDAEVILRFDLFSRRNGGTEILVGSWKFRRFLTTLAVDNPNQNLETSDTFSFNRCVCSSPCPGCIDYFVRVTAEKISDNDTASAKVSMGQLIAKSQEC
ncbi:DUF4489 domain-containing protein [Anaeromicrobium sediminis]|uniref:Uncharacterized protein n=1 Tax=Anaeromicrobium sediminis TaxID=1478221 RepID=A0A267M8G9_9FIRM|nr:DUF4489 domain-containing protein [Anaeromicrobium sediminis]PAB55859.1 hypothetical protein CCE28_21520 [Anaeromicrobium sediminis]